MWRDAEGTTAGGGQRPYRGRFYCCRRDLNVAATDTCWGGFAMI